MCMHACHVNICRPCQCTECELVNVLHALCVQFDGPCNHFPSLGKLLQVKCARVLAKDGDMSTGDISRTYTTMEL